MPRNSERSSRFVAGLLCAVGFLPATEAVSDTSVLLTPAQMDEVAAGALSAAGMRALALGNSTATIADTRAVAVLTGPNSESAQSNATGGAIGNDLAATGGVAVSATNDISAGASGSGLAASSGKLAYADTNLSTTAQTTPRKRTASASATNTGFAIDGMAATDTLTQLATAGVRVNSGSSASSTGDRAYSTTSNRITASTGGDIR